MIKPHKNTSSPQIHKERGSPKKNGMGRSGGGKTQFNYLATILDVTASGATCVRERKGRKVTSLAVSS